MRKTIAKCYCRGNAYLYQIDKPGRIGDKFAKVLSVPTYICSDCGMAFSEGSDCIIYARRVREAIDEGKDEIQF